MQVRVRERDVRPAERKFVPIVLRSIDTEVWPTSKMLDINISVSSDLGGCVPTR